MTTMFIVAGVVLFALMVLVLIRAILGPTSIDRMISVNVIGTKATVILLLIGAVYERVDMYVDLALSYALLNFIASIAAARLVRRRRTTDTWDVVAMGLRHAEKADD